MIPESLLLEYGATLESLPPDELIFSEKTDARFYYQIKTGKIKMFNLNESGREFIQGLFADGDSFGEPPLFADIKYPASAATVKQSEFYKLSKEKLMDLLGEHPKIGLKFTRAMAKRLYYKAMILNEITNHPPEHRILTLIDYLKKKHGTTEAYKVKLTRQQIADLTGLRVETVIRAVKQLEQDGEIEIIKRKVFR